MSDANIFQLFGLFYLAMGLGFLMEPDYYKDVLDKMINNEAVLFLTGVMIFIAGFLLTAFHNTWGWNCGVVITVLGWAVAIKGLMIFVMPETSVKLYKKTIKRIKKLTPYSICLIVIGLVFVSLSYFV